MNWPERARCAPACDLLEDCRLERSRLLEWSSLCCVNWHTDVEVVGGVGGHHPLPPTSVATLGLQQTFSGLSRENLESVAKLIRGRYLVQGEIYVEQGQWPEAVSFVLKGSVGLYSKGDNNRKHEEASGAPARCRQPPASPVLCNRLFDSVRKGLCEWIHIHVSCACAG